jgi:hypothetical protein
MLPRFIRRQLVGYLRTPVRIFYVPPRSVLLVRISEWL